MLDRTQGPNAILLMSLQSRFMGKCNINLADHGQLILQTGSPSGIRLQDTAHAQRKAFSQYCIARGVAAH